MSILPILHISIYIKKCKVINKIRNIIYDML